MPIYLRPDKTFKVSLAGDASLPADKRPHFIGKFISAGQRIEIADKIEEVKTSARNLKKIDGALDEAIKKLVVGLVNFPPAANLDGVLPQLTNGEKWELIYAILNENEMGAELQKNSASP